jgi:plastocyanin
MKGISIQPSGLFVGLLAGLLLVLSTASIKAQAEIPGISGPTFSLSAGSGYISTPDGDSVLIWSYGLDGGAVQYPGPTLIVNQGDTVTINLTNSLTQPVSMLFPGQLDVSAVGGTCATSEDCLITRESTSPSDTVTYQFTATQAGTYMYHSATNTELQTEMGLVGTLIVRPPASGRAYSHGDTAYDQEYLFFLTEMDPRIHHKVDAGFVDQVDFTDYKAVLWFMNGRNGPDTMSPAFVPWMPHQPYNILPRTHPGDTVLMRVISASHHMHPLHTHGNNFTVIANDARLLESSAGSGPDLGRSDFTLQTVSFHTYDALWQWTGKGLGWDIYGHDAGDALAPNEYVDDHGKPLPVTLPELQDLTFGGFYSGSPFLGVFGNLPPGEGGLNLEGGLFFMWHSHTEKELVNNDVFPGGMMTMMIIEPPGVPIP